MEVQYPESWAEVRLRVAGFGRIRLSGDKGIAIARAVERAEAGVQRPHKALQASVLSRSVASR